MRQDRKVQSLRPLTARSVVLSTLLGTHPPALPAGALVRVGELFGITEGTLRVALSRLAAAGDLTASNGSYRLSGRLLDRQRRQDESRSPRTRAWRGRWEIAVVTAEGRSATERAALRTAMGGLRLAELREGVWLRPANLRRDIPATVAEQCTLAEGSVRGEPGALAASLWDLDAWAAASESLLGGMKAAASPAERFTVAAGMARHMLDDPLLPDELVPADWPGPALRTAYAAFGHELRDLLATAIQ
jgi:phenylacetic acid degradation operon negative regulatory protein